MREMRDLRWRTSSYSDSGSECVMVNGDLDKLGDSKNPNGPILEVTPAALAAFIQAIKSGEL